jgi:hypothetical protein
MDALILMGDGGGGGGKIMCFNSPQVRMSFVIVPFKLWDFIFKLLIKERQEEIEKEAECKKLSTIPWISVTIILFASRSLRRPIL